MKITVECVQDVIIQLHNDRLSKYYISMYWQISGVVILRWTVRKSGAIKLLTFVVFLFRK